MHTAAASTGISRPVGRLLSAVTAVVRLTAILLIYWNGITGFRYLVEAIGSRASLMLCWTDDLDVHV